MREAALVNPKTSWKMRMEGAEDPRTSAKTLIICVRSAGATRGQDLVLSAMVGGPCAENPRPASRPSKPWPATLP